MSSTPEEEEEKSIIAKEREAGGAGASKALVFSESSQALSPRGVKRTFFDAELEKSDTDEDCIIVEEVAPPPTRLSDSVNNNHSNKRPRSETIVIE